MRKKKRKILAIVTLVILGLVVLRYALGYSIRWYLNSRIDEMENFSGTVGRVSINPLEGIYALGDIDLSYMSDTMDVPVINVRSIGFNLDWGTLFSGTVAGEIFIADPDVRVITKLAPEEDVPPKGPPLSRVFRNFVPVQLDVIRLADGELRMRDETQPAPFEIDITELRGEIRNLTNTRQLSEDLFASGEIYGIVLRSGDLNLDISIAPVAEQLQFTLLGNISGIQLVQLNDFVNELAGITFSSGTLSIDLDINADQGFITGSATTVYENLTFHDPESDVGLIERLKEGIADTGAEIIEDDDERIVTSVPFEFTTEGTKPDVLFAVMTILQQSMTLAAIPIVGDIAGEQPD